MGVINYGRVVAGGLLAGFIINVVEVASQFVFADWYAQFFEDLELAPMGSGAMTVLIVGAFVLGILTVWLYAAARPRFGPGPMTALRVGFVVWVVGWLWQMVVDVATGLYSMPAGMWVVSCLWTLVEVELAALAGGSLYREAEPKPAVVL